MPTQSNNLKPLQGLRIIITREAEKAQEFKNKLEDEGAIPILFPTIKTVPIVKPEYKKDLQELSSFDWIIFTSANSVKYFFALLEDYGFKFPDSLKVAAIGSATTKALNNRGVKTDLKPEKAVGEGLVDAFSKVDLKGRKILFPRAKIARELVVEELGKMGAKVKLLVVYETLPCTDYLEEALKELEKGVDIVTFTSASTAKNFYRLLKGRLDEDKLKGLKVVCIGPVTAEAVKELGYQVDAVAEQYDTDGLVETLKELALNYYSCS